MGFVTELVVDDAFRQRFENQANREEMMDDAELSHAAKEAIRSHSVAKPDHLMANQQIVSPPSKVKTKPSKKKPAGKKADGSPRPEA
jgi:hypothetical protein